MHLNSRNMMREHFSGHIKLFHVYVLYISDISRRLIEPRVRPMPLWTCFSPHAVRYFEFKYVFFIFRPQIVCILLYMRLFISQSDSERKISKWSIYESNRRYIYYLFIFENYAYIWIYLTHLWMSGRTYASINSLLLHMFVRIDVTECNICIVIYIYIFPKKGSKKVNRIGTQRRNLEKLEAYQTIFYVQNLG